MKPQLERRSVEKKMHQSSQMGSRLAKSNQQQQAQDTRMSQAVADSSTQHVVGKAKQKPTSNKVRNRASRCERSSDRLERSGALDGKREAQKRTVILSTKCRFPTVWCGPKSGRNTSKSARLQTRADAISRKISASAHHFEVRRFRTEDAGRVHQYKPVIPSPCVTQNLKSTARSLGWSQ